MLQIVHHAYHPKRCWGFSAGATLFGNIFLDSLRFSIKIQKTTNDGMDTSDTFFKILLPDRLGTEFRSE